MNSKKHSDSGQWIPVSTDPCSSSQVSTEWAPLSRSSLRIYWNSFLHRLRSKPVPSLGTFATSFILTVLYWLIVLLLLKYS